MDDKEFQKEIQEQVRKTLAPIFNKYEMDVEWLNSTMKWKPLVLVIGSYSSGKSTLINELLGFDVQRTGQAPTDDSFTILCNEGENVPVEIPGSTLVNDPRYPFAGLKAFGENLISHLCLKNVASPLLENAAIIDTPGMIDSTAERDRGYRYLDVIGDLAAMADMIVLMFDPHKAGTIKENFSAIRNVLPGKTGEDRVVYVLSRIDECDNLSDLVRSYGALCWNISQMTGRKDMPHIFLTYSPREARLDQSNQEWPQERLELRDKIGSAHHMRINHILENVDRKTGELELVCEALHSFSSRAGKLLSNTLKWTSVAALAVFVLGFILLKGYQPLQEHGIISGIGGISLFSLEVMLPLTGALLTFVLGWFFFARVRFKALMQQASRSPERLVNLDTDYRKSLWSKVKGHVIALITGRTIRQHLLQTRGSLERVRKFVRKDLKEYYSKIGQPPRR
ncbi:dynamin family protein [Desulfonatronospira sp.]|uniref:dynamin family protein n=1 Tax=Desulfonatronospira sp. TaxID=1962951 RepID=UPI0025B95A86|nr:dynamin family protein [Desulfonatronospira sp.]